MERKEEGEMKIEIMEVKYVRDEDGVRVEECGFKVGEVVEVWGE